MRRGWMVLLAMMLVVPLLAGCGGKSGQPEQSVNTAINKAPNPELDLSLDKVREELRVNEKEDMSVEEIRRFVLGTDNLMRILQESGEPDNDYHLIGTINDVYVLKYKGDYDTMDRVMQLLGDYFSPRAAEKQLLRRGFVNLNGKIGHPLFSGEGLSFDIHKEKSRFKILEDGKDHKLVEISVID